MHLLGCLVGSEAESCESRRGLLLLSGFGRGVTGQWPFSRLTRTLQGSGFQSSCCHVSPPFFFFATHFPASETAYFFFFLASLEVLWDLSSPTRN